MPRVQFLLPLFVLSFILAGDIMLNAPGPSQLVVRSHPDATVYFFPNGYRKLFPHYRLVALYGTPGEPVLGALGAQPLDVAIVRVKKLAQSYQPLTNEHVLPALEIIATVASDSPQADKSYSYPISQSTIAEWATASRNAGVYVVLDLQPGRTDFLTQAKRLQPLLEQPNVGLALDPEWRLTGSQLPLEQIGTVQIGEVNATAQWLAALTRQHGLPQKLFLVHQFRLDTLPDRSRLDTTHPELAYAVQMDGQGTQAEKLDTWHTITSNPPNGIHFGWKNFYKKDTPVRSAKDTMSVTPIPWYISYQ
jgi:hypothetical protein